MQTFALIITIFAADGTDHSAVLDYNLTGKECVARIADFADFARAAEARLACEVEPN